MRILGYLRVVLEFVARAWAPNILRHPYREDPKRDPGLEKLPYLFPIFVASTVEVLEFWGVRVLGQSYLNRALRESCNEFGQ